MSFIIFSAVARFGFALLLAFVLIKVGHLLNLVERIGIGLMGGSGLLTVAVILDIDSHGTPFDGWASALFTLGGILFFPAFVYRKLRHERVNEKAVSEAAAYLKSKGKLA